MTNPPVALPAQFAFLTEPTPGHVVLDLHTEQGVARAILSPQQLANLVADGARFMRPMVRTSHV